MTHTRIDPDLIRRYNRPGPRYTSYPTAPHFTDALGPDAFKKEIIRSNAPDAERRDLSLYLHLPFCHALCYYCGCHMMVTHRPEKIARYLSYLEREIDLAAGYIHPDRIVRQIHWGGGTPTYLEPDQIESLMRSTQRRFQVADDAEVGIEADPRHLTREHLEAARRSGFNRISIGVQDFDARVQKAIGRIQPEPLVRETVNACRDLAFDSISFDLIYGLPFQTRQTFETTLDLALALNPDRVSLFSYAHVPWMKKHQQMIPEAGLPGPDLKMEIFLRAVEKLTQEGGYRYIGMDHFAKPEDSLCAAQDAGTLHRNFQGYSTHAGCDIQAFGISGISQLEWVYAQNVKDLPAYYEDLDAGRLPVERGVRLQQDDQIRRFVITRLMSNFVLRKAEVESCFGICFDDYFGAALQSLQPMAADGLIALASDTLRVTEQGRFFIRNIAMAFDAYLPRSQHEAPRYSQTV